MAEETATPAPGRMYRRHCAYDLRLLDKPRCPECGTPFDPADGRTFRHRPPGARAKWLRRAGALILLTTMLLGGAWGWMYWGWRQEQQALAQLPGADSGAEPVGPRWLYPRLGRAGFVLARVRLMCIPPRSSIADLSPVARLSFLEELFVDGTPVRDVTPLSKLGRLQTLHLERTQVQDLSPLSNNKSLVMLVLDDTPVRDVSAISTLKGLRSLSLKGTDVRNLACLAKLSGLRVLALPLSADPEDVGALARALPGCRLSMELSGRQLERLWAAQAARAATRSATEPHETPSPTVPPSSPPPVPPH